MPAKKILRETLLLWLSGAALRMTILAVPPVIPLLQRDLQMSGTEIGVLSGLPTILLALVAIPGAFAISRFGALATLIGGLVLTAIGTGLRGIVFNVATLYLTTIIMSAGIAIAQPTLPVIVRQWLPTRIGFGTATYSNGLVAGCIVAIGLMLPVLMPLVDNDWRAALAIWSLPVLIVAGLLMLLAPRLTAREHIDARSSGWATLDYSLLWRIGLIFGANNSVYFGTNAFLPGYLTDAGRPDLISLVLTVYNVCQLPSSLFVIVFAKHLERRVWPYLFVGTVALASIAGIIASPSDWMVLATATLGLASGTMLALGLTLPPLLSAPAQVGRVSAVMFMLSYAYAMLVSVCAGVVWDLTGWAVSALVLIAISVLPLLLLIPTIRFARADHATHAADG